MRNETMNPSTRALGALLGAVNGLAGWPERWREGLLYRPRITS